jgi:DNA-binding LytR/AlgR family response regulator
MKTATIGYPIGHVNFSSPPFGNSADAQRLIPVKQSKQTVLLCSSSIAYARSEHVYVEIFFGGNQRMVHRDSLSGLVDKLPEDVFLRVHRSFVVDLNRVSGWRSDALYVGKTVIPISRSRRREVLERLESL